MRSRAMQADMGFEDRYDVLIAGARCAGASTALLASRAGLRVLVVDPLPPGRDALSTHALMRGAVLQLHRWGLLDRLREAGTPAVRVTTFDYGDEVVPVAIEERDGVDALYAPRRTVLDPLLESAAVAAGATVRRGWALRGVIRDGTGRVVGGALEGPGGARRTVRARWVVGADGARSRMARLVEATVLRRGRHAAATLYGYWSGLPPTEFRWIFRPGLGLGTIPTNGGESCVFVSMPPARFASTGGDLLERFRSVVAAGAPELAERLAGGGPQGPIRGFAGFPGFLRRAAGPGWALVGDAGYFRDPLTAHGITDAFRDAELLARALASDEDGAMEVYQATRDAAAEDLFAVTDAIASLEWTPVEIRELHRALARAMKGAAAPLVREARAA